MTISTLAWVLVGIGGWLVAAVVVAFGLARFLRLREERIGRDRPPMPRRRAPEVAPAPPAEAGKQTREAPRETLRRPVPRVPQQRRPTSSPRPRIGPSSRRG